MQSLWTHFKSSRSLLYQQHLYIGISKYIWVHIDILRKHTYILPKYCYINNQKYNEQWLFPSNVSISGDKLTVRLIFQYLQLLLPQVMRQRLMWITLINDVLVMLFFFRKQNHRFKNYKSISIFLIMWNFL